MCLGFFSGLLIPFPHVLMQAFFEFYQKMTSRNQASSTSGLYMLYGLKTLKFEVVQISHRSNNHFFLHVKATQSVMKTTWTTAVIVRCGGLLDESLFKRCSNMKKLMSYDWLNDI